MARIPKSYEKMPKLDEFVKGLIVIKKIPFSFDIHGTVRDVVKALEQDGYATEVERSGYVVELLGKTFWRVETKSKHFLSEFRRQIARSPGTKMSYEVEIIPSHKEVLERLNARNWASDYLRFVGRNRWFDSSITEFALVHANRLHRWSSIDGIVGWVLRKLGLQKHCQFCGRILTFPYVKCLIAYGTPLYVCSELTACELREQDSRRNWEARRAEGVRL